MRGSSAPVIAALAGVALYAYFFTNPPRAHFGMYDQSRWIPLGVQPGIVVAIFVGLHRRRDHRPDH